MRIGIIGLGSIGKRHAKCLSGLGITDLVAWRSGSAPNELVGSLPFIKHTYSEEEFYAFSPDAVLVANPTALHVPAMLTALTRNVPVLVEKPISDRVTPAQFALLRQHKNMIVVGYCMRFLPAVSQIKTFLKADRAGRFCKAAFARSYYLPMWHPQTDYRTEYAARKDLGGGVIRTLSHEIDLMHYLFGKAESVTGMLGNVSDLELDVEDVASFSCRLQSGAQVHFELDFLSPVNISSADILTTTGKLSYRFHDRQLQFHYYSGEVVDLTTPESFDGELMYRAQMEDFLQFIRTGKSQNCSLEDGLQVLKVIEAVEQAKPVFL